MGGQCADLVLYCSSPIPISIYIPVLAQVRKGLSGRSKLNVKLNVEDPRGIERSTRRCKIEREECSPIDAINSATEEDNIWIP